jgi:LacI family transcriptional regulator
LASSRTNIAGAIIPTLDVEVFARQVSGLQSIFMKQNITVFLGCSNYDPASSLSHARAMLARGVEALAIVGEDHPPELFEELADRDVPYVITYAYRPVGPHQYVGFDHATAFYEIVEHLFRLGHRRFAVILQPTANNSRVQARLAGIRSAISDHGLSLSDDNMCVGSYDIGFGATSLARLMDRSRKERPTAIVCGNDTLAIGALAGAAELGLSAPADFSLTGFDDLSISSLLRPHLTTMSVDNFTIGSLAAEQLLARLKGEAGHSITVPPTLITRDTTGAPPD